MLKFLPYGGNLLRVQAGQRGQAAPLDVVGVDEQVVARDAVGGWAQEQRHPQPVLLAELVHRRAQRPHVGDVVARQRREAVAEMRRHCARARGALRREASAQLALRGARSALRQRRDHLQGVSSEGSRVPVGAAACAASLTTNANRLLLGHE